MGEATHEGARGKSQHAHRLQTQSYQVVESFFPAKLPTAATEITFVRVVHTVLKTAGRNDPQF